ncbi:MAG: peptide chain release factor N(5)-glutamine methyltransferase [Ruminococcaceae bacterium]|nr:peptide chain release factor N(5)-glutamine methyltransferase [Oscillospiraceae bacterium]
MTLKEQKELIIAQLDNISDCSAFEANEIIVFATDLDRSGLLYKQNENLSAGEQKIIKKCISKRKKGVPLQYILGEWEFYSLPFKVGKGVLIPRADSELLVDLVIEEISSREEIISLLDLCSGSGALGIAVAKNCSNAKVTLVEKSRKAFSYLKENAQLNGVKVSSVRADIFKWKPQNPADIVICNPPYITWNEMLHLQKEVKKEPTAALFGGNDGLKFYRFLCSKAKDFLKIGGKMFVEIGYKQADDVKALFESAGFEQIEVFKDLGGNDRVVSAVLNK